MGLPEGWQDASNTGMTLALWADDRGDANALTGPHGTRTFTELNAEANRLVRLLDDRGLEEGDGVVLLCGNRPEFASTYAATHRRGLRLTAVNWHLTAEETAYIADDCEAKAIVADVELADVATAVAETTPLLTTRIAAGGAIDGFDPWDDALGADDGVEHRRPGARQLDALHVGHDRPPQGRVPQEGGGPARRRARRSTTTATATVTSAPGRCTTPRRWPSRSPSRS